MNKFSLFLAKHSQKIMFTCTAGVLSLTYYVQPHYEAIIRWSVTKLDVEWEEKPSKRILKVKDEVLSKFRLSNEQKTQLDIFLTPLDEPLVTGSLSTPGYAFIGLPYFFGYNNESEIPLDSLDFYRSYFPYGPFSKIGRERLELMILPESALKFLLAREIVRLHGQTIEGSKLRFSGRSQSLITSSGVIGALYLSYQLIFTLNRIMKLTSIWALPARLIFYTFISLLAVFIQYQIMIAWRRYRCYKVDQIVAGIDNSFRQGGIDYYDWRLKWNRFWSNRIKEFRLSKKNTKNKKTKSDNFDPVLAYQNEVENFKQSTAKQSDYYLPSSENSNIDESVKSEKHYHLQKPTIGSNFLLKYYRNSRYLLTNGNELWAGDGDAINFGLTGMFSLGIIPSVFTSILHMFSNPATSLQRSNQLKKIPQKYQ